MDHRGSALLVAAATLLLALSGCGDDTVTAGESATDPSSSTSTPTSDGASSEGTTSEASNGLPSCADVWADGATLPDDYAGCDNDGEAVEPEALNCSSGQVIVTFDDTYWAVPGAAVQVTDGLAEDGKFKRAKLSCFG